VGKGKETREGDVGRKRRWERECEEKAKGGEVEGRRCLLLHWLLWMDTCDGILHSEQ